MMSDRASTFSDPEITEVGHEAGAARLEFRELYDTYFAFVWRAVANRGVPFSAMDDVTQEVFLVVHRKLDQFQGHSTVRTWLAGIVRRVVADHRKKRGNQATGQATLEDYALASTEDPIADLERRATVELVSALLEKMSEAQREVFILYELEQLTTREIAELTGTNENTVQTRLQAARRTFKQKLERHRASIARRDT
jgi:RNA polymerase sigma-70 factor (ECF subfamily)